MRIKTGICLRAACLFLVIGVFVMVKTSNSFAANDPLAQRSETEFVKVLSADENSLNTTANRFIITKDTKFHNDHGAEIKYSDIKKYSIVHVLYRRTNGQLIASDIIVVKESESSNLPE